MAAAAEVLAQWATMQATWRAFWFDPPMPTDKLPCLDLKQSFCMQSDACMWEGASWRGKCVDQIRTKGDLNKAIPAFLSLKGSGSRLQRQFISILMTYGSFAVVGALRGRYLRCMFAVFATTAVVLRVLYVSVFYSDPAALAGVVGLIFGTSLVSLTLVLPQLLDSNNVMGKHAKDLFGELSDLGDTMFSKSTVNTLVLLSSRTATAAAAVVFVGALLFVPMIFFIVYAIVTHTW